MKKIIALAAAMVMVAGFAYAGDWNFYGSARVATFFSSVDDNVVGTSDVDNYEHFLQGNSRVGANVKVSDELSGRFEYGTGVNVRLLYGEWNFGGGTFLVGQTYSPLNMFYSNQVYGFGGDADLLGMGGVYSGREAMLRLKYGGFQVAIMPANTAGITVGLVDGAATPDFTDGGIISANAETDDFAVGEVQMPAIEASYGLKLGSFSLKLAGGYQTYEIVNGTTDIDVDSYVIALGAGLKFGAGYLQGNIYTGQNAGNLIWVESKAKAGINAAGTDTDDCDVTGMLIVAGAKLNDMFSVELGYAKVSGELDSDTDSDDVSSYYAQTVISIAPGVSVIPEIGVNDYDSGSKITYFGAKWMINF